MVKNFLTYTAPDILETHIELESAICGGSVDIVNPDKQDIGRINEQKINSDFDSDSFSDNKWSDLGTSEN